MRTAFVADASVAIGWVHPAQATDATAAALEAMEGGAVIEVPALWPLEVANALTALVRRRKLAEEDRRTALQWFRNLPIKVDHEAATLAFSRLAELVSEHQLTVYDAAYLELAERRRLALACADGALRKAVAERGLRLWP